MLNEWIETIKVLGFDPEIFREKEGGGTLVALWYLYPTTERVRVFLDIDPDKALQEAMTFALNYDAYIANAALCGHPH